MDDSLVEMLAARAEPVKKSTKKSTADTNSRIITKVKTPDGKTRSGLVIPDTPREKMPKGEVLPAKPARTNTKTLAPLGVRKGSVVTFTKT